MLVYLEIEFSKFKELQQKQQQQQNHHHLVHGDSDTNNQDNCKYLYTLMFYLQHLELYLERNQRIFQNKITLSNIKLAKISKYFLTRSWYFNNQNI